MLMIALALFLVLLIPLAAYLLLSADPIAPQLRRAAERTTEIFRLTLPQRHGRTPLILTSHRQHLRAAEDSSRITSAAFPAFRR